MLDPRIYRTGLIAVAVGVILLAFSLTDQPGPLGTTLPPEAFNGQNAYKNMVGLAKKFPQRSPGSNGDDRLAAAVATALRRDNFAVTARSAPAHTADGTRTLETVTAARPGIGSGSIVVVSHRDSSGSPDPAGLSGTAVMLELGRVLAGQTQHRALVLVSTSGSSGAAGATQVARNLSRLGTTVDAVIVLGDMASSGLREPIVVPWSNGQQVAPPLLRNTLSAAIDAQAGLDGGQTSLLGQFAHLAFPLSVTEQGPFGAAGYPAALVSLAGQRAPDPEAPVAGPDRITGLGQGMLQAVNSLDGGPPMPGPRPYLLFDTKVIPPWAVSLLVLTLIIPVLLTTIDGLARARRRGHPILRWVLWVLAGALPFALAALVVYGAKLVGLLDITPPGPTGAGEVPLGGAGIAVLTVAAAVIVLTLLARRPLVRTLTGGQPLGSPSNPGAGAAVLVVMCAVSLAIWLRNPFAAALLVPALHLWMWVLDPKVRIPRPVTALLMVAGLAPPVLVALYYGRALGLGPVDAAWTGVLMLAGGYVGVVNALLCSLVLGCLASAVSIAIRRPRPDRPRKEELPVTVRGPVTYAGPGSLGGTKSALRR